MFHDRCCGKVIAFHDAVQSTSCFLRLSLYSRTRAICWEGPMKFFASILITALMLCSLLASGQSIQKEESILKEGPSQKKELILANILSFGSTVLMAQAVKYGTRACLGEGEQFQIPGYKPTGPYDHRLPRDMYQHRTYA